MVVVASTTNTNGTLDMESMMKRHEVGRNAEWFPIFKRNCKDVVVTGNSWHSLVSIRGSLFEFGSKNPKGIWVGEDKIRCPVHRVDYICNLGNKTIVDLVVAIDPTGINRKDSGWTFEVDFPLGFTPMCYTSKTSSLQHLAVLFRSLGAMAVDISPVSYTLLWDIAEKCSIELDSVSIAQGQYHKLEVLNANPSTKYEVKIQSEVSDRFATVVLKTQDVTEESMKLFYLSRKRDDGVFDLEGVNNETILYLRKKGILKSGQRVRVKPESKCYTVSVVVSGDTVSLTNKEHLYVVPDFSVDEDQFICLEDECGAEGTSRFPTSHVIEFDKSESYVKYRNRVYPHGTHFSVVQDNMARQISVVQGSIILVVSDAITTFPGGDAAALQVMTSGDVIARDLVMRCSAQVTQKVDGETTYGRNSYYVYNPDDGTTLQCTRLSHGLNDAGDTGSFAVDLLYTDENSDQSLVNTISSDPTNTSISARSPAGPEVVTATFNAAGLSFDSDNGNIYFGADKDFRIHYQEESGLDPAMLQIQSLTVENGVDSYLTRFLITAEPP